MTTSSKKQLAQGVSPAAHASPPEKAKCKDKPVAQCVQWWKPFFETIRCDMKEDWSRISHCAKTLILVRASVLHITFPTALVPIAVAHSRGTLQPWAGPFWFLSFVCFHMSHNMLNDALDFFLGRDNHKSFRLQYGVHALSQKFVSNADFGLLLATVTGAALACTWALRHMWPAWLFAGVIACSIFYTWPLKGYGIGELCVFCVWGPISIIGGYQAITGIYDRELFWLSVPSGLSATGILFGKHIDKISESATNKVYTMPVLLGESLARYMAITIVFSMYIAILGLVWQEWLPSYTAIIIFLPAYWTLPLFLKVFLAARPDMPPGLVVSICPCITFDAKKLWPIWYVGSAFFQLNMLLYCFTFCLVVQSLGTGVTL